jgi:hypothetical protein
MNSNYNHLFTPINLASGHLAINNRKIQNEIDLSAFAMGQIVAYTINRWQDSFFDPNEKGPFYELDVNFCRPLYMFSKCLSLSLNGFLFTFLHHSSRQHIDEERNQMTHT